MSKKNQITVAEVINSQTLTPDEMKNLLKEFSALKAKIAKLPKEQMKALRSELGHRVISGKLLELKDRLIPIIREYREVLKAEFDKTVRPDKPKGNKSISLRVDVFNLAIIRSIKK